MQATHTAGAFASGVSRDLRLWTCQSNSERVAAHHAARHRNENRWHAGHGSPTDQLDGATLLLDLLRYRVRADVRTPHEVLRNNSYRGGLPCFGEFVWTRVLGMRLLRGNFEVSWNADEHMRGGEVGERKSRTTRRQPE